MAEAYICCVFACQNNAEDIIPVFVSLDQGMLNTNLSGVQRTIGAFSVTAV